MAIHLSKQHLQTISKVRLQTEPATQRGQEIQDTKDSKHTDRECRLGEVNVHFFGDNLAVLYGSESRIGKDADGTERIKTLIWTDTWLKRNGQWQIVAAQDNWAKAK
jgi:Domain of unknown function (DUF4440)